MPNQSRPMRTTAGARFAGRVAAAAAVLLAGCSLVPAAPDVAAEPDLPAAWSGPPPPAGTGASAAWWQSFDDPQLSSLVARSLQSNTDILGAQAALRQARALRDVAAAGLQPTLSASASAALGTSGGTSTGNRFQAGLDAGWELDLFGERRSALDSSEASARASAASLGSLQVSIAAEVALSYITLRSAQARLAIASENLDTQLQTLQITEWRARAGLLSALEVEQSRGAAAQTQAQLPALQTSTLQAAHALAVLTGQPPAALAALVAQAAPVPRAAATLALDIPAQTLRQRPDVRAAEAQVLAAQARVSQAYAARYPNFRLGGSLGLSALALGSLGSSALATSLLASVSLPLWDGGAARAQVQAQQAALEQARASYRGTVLAALKDVEDALVALRGELQRAERLQQAADAAALAAELARQRFSSGLVDFQTVLETQRSQLATRDSLANASAAISASHVRLFKALGGGWRADEIAATTPHISPRPGPP